MRYLIFALLLAGSVSAQNGPRIHQHKHYDTTIVEDYQKIKRRRLTTDVDSTGFAMYAWGDECFFKVQLREPGSVMNHYETGMLNGYPYVLYGGNNFWYKMYMTEYGAFEFDASLRKKPPNGIHSITFPIQAKGLTFYYQPASIAEWGLEQWEIDRGLLPADSVLGSYAVYHSTQENNVNRANGDFEEYMIGKAFHIFRPRAWDVNDGTAWGFVDIVWDSISADSIMFGNMELGVDSVWLASKKFPKDYPVTIDPIIGHSDVGATSSNPSSGSRIWGLGPHEALSAGNADSMSVYVASGAGVQITLGFYDDDSDYPGSLMADGDGGYTSVAAAWNVQVLDAPAAITEATPYWLGVAMQNNNIYLKYDAVGGFARWRVINEPYVDGSLVDPFAGSAVQTTSRKYSIFVYCTAEGEPEGGGWQGGVIPVSIQ